jgi:NAD(P)-dependent dehydrogenase (short-subunit alcohol dehydrogenase family)
LRRILITGSNRGIGLELVRRYLQYGDTLIFATCRRPADANALNVLAEQNPKRLKLFPLDVTDQVSIDESRDWIGTQTDDLEMLINNAGILPGGNTAREPNIASFGSLDANAMMQVFQVNSVAPVIVAQAYADLLRRGTSARLINLSSAVGSITRREDGCDYSYPASKAALNMMTRCLAGSFREDKVVVISIHPGWIQTDMGGPYATLTLEDAVPSLMNVIDRLTMADTGAFFNWDGTRLPW